jgi:uncharacterized protein (TIGR01244 family)
VSDFRKLSESVWASPQLSMADVQEAAHRGFALIINNRPDGESDDQVPGSEIEAAARLAGMDYVTIPITHAGFSEPQVLAMESALAGATGPVLAYCRSGTRSTLLWSLAEAHSGKAPAMIAAAAAAAGYDIAPVRPAVDFYASQTRD